MEHEEEDRLIIITIKYGTEVFQVDITEGSHVNDLKNQLVALIQLSSELQRLVYNGRILRETDLVDDLDEQTVYVVRISETQTQGTVSAEALSSAGFGSSPMAHLSPQSKMLQDLVKSPFFKVTTRLQVYSLLVHTFPCELSSLHHHLCYYICRA